MYGKIKDVFSGLSWEVLNEIRASAQKRLDDVAFEERIVGIENATAAMLEVGVEEEKIIQMLQKYWDLRPSEATTFVHREKGLFD